MASLSFWIKLKAGLRPHKLAETTRLMDALKIRYLLGWILIGLVGGTMLFAGFMKFSGLAPAEVTQELFEANLLQKMRLIGMGAWVTGVLLLIPRTMPLGVWLASAYWGGAIVTHWVAKDEILSAQAPMILLSMTWLGAALRQPEILGLNLAPKQNASGKI